MVIVACALLPACASTGAVPRPFPMPGAAPGPAEPGERPARPAPKPPGGPAAADGYALSSTALSLRGAPYRNGGDDPTGFDCSEFVKYVFEQHGVQVLRETRKQ